MASHYKSWQLLILQILAGCLQIVAKLLQIMAAITNRGKIITNRETVAIITKVGITYIYFKTCNIIWVNHYHYPTQ